MSSSISPLRHRLSRRGALMTGLGAMLAPGELLAQQPTSVTTTSTTCGGVDVEMVIELGEAGIGLKLFMINHNERAIRVEHRHNGVTLVPATFIGTLDDGEPSEIVDEGYVQWEKAYDRRGILSRTVRTSYRTIAGARRGKPTRVAWATVQGAWPEGITAGQVGLMMLTTWELELKRPRGKSLSFAHRAALLHAERLSWTMSAAVS